jgi:DNA mismatch endonuclease Vsr
MRVSARDVGTSARLGRQRQAGTKAEKEVGTALRVLGRAYRKNVRSLPGSPDFANQRARWAVFVNGCYWHHHKGCPRATVPKSNHLFWLDKFAANRRRDARKIRELRRKGLRVAIIWECQAGQALERLAKIFEASGVGR